MEPSVELAQLIGNAEKDSGPRQCFYLNSALYCGETEEIFLPATSNEFFVFILIF